MRKVMIWSAVATVAAGVALAARRAVSPKPADEVREAANGPADPRAGFDAPTLATPTATRVCNCAMSGNWCPVHGNSEKPAPSAGVDYEHPGYVAPGPEGDQ